MGWMAAIPGIASAAGSIASMFGKKETGGQQVSLEQLMPAWQKQLGSDLSSWVNKYMGQYVPGQAYTGQFTAGPTSQEQTGLNLLTQFLGNAPTGDTFKAGNQQLLDTLGGKFANPNESPFIKSMMNLSKLNLQDAIDTSRAQRGARGTYFTKAALGEERQLQDRAQTNLQSLIGDFVNQERNRMFQAVPIAQAMDKYSTVEAPLQKMLASQSIGGLMRTIDQGDLESRYNEFKRQRGEMALPLSLGQSLYGSNAQMGVPSVTYPTGEKTTTVGNIGNILSLFGGAMGGVGGIGSLASGQSQGGSLAPLLAMLGFQGQSRI